MSTTLLEWSTKLATNVQAMDEEHQKLIQLMNALYALCKTNASKPAITDALNALGAYTVQHFTDEENYMQSVQYKGIDTHKIVHKQLLDKFSEYANQFTQGNDLVLPDEFFQFLTFWLTTHIMHIDVKYGR